MAFFCLSLENIHLPFYHSTTEMRKDIKIKLKISLCSQNGCSLSVAKFHEYKFVCVFFCISFSVETRKAFSESEMCGLAHAVVEREKEKNVFFGSFI
jgi:hypothetical protein